MKENSDVVSPLVMSRLQRSHVLFVLSNAKKGREGAFLDWYREGLRQVVLAHSGVLGIELYEQHPMDITAGKFPRLPFHYMAVCELSFDGAEAARKLIETISHAHQENACADDPATWLYYPASEKVGRSAYSRPSMLTLAFANSIPGQEDEFREWYATRHIRHALNLSALVSGQYFERALFQKPGVAEARFSAIAVYEQEGTPESIIEGFATLPESTFDFPMLDLARFAEAVYTPV